MRLPERHNIFRLGQATEDAVFCDADGLSVGDVDLLERASDPRGANGWRPRATAQLNRELSQCYGLPIEIEPKARGLKSVADALARGDLVHAQMVALHLRLPDPPKFAKSVGDVKALVDLASRLDASGLLKGDWDPALHPRWPAGSQDSVGGQFARRDAQGGGGTVSGVRNAGGQSGAHVTQAQITVTAPGAFPAPFDVPMPGSSDSPLPSEITPPPIVGPGVVLKTPLARGETLDPAEWDGHQVGWLYQADSYARLGDETADPACCARLQDDVWTPGLNGAPAGNKAEIAARLKDIASEAYGQRS